MRQLTLLVLFACILSACASGGSCSGNCGNPYDFRKPGGAGVFMG
jgi:hypothetical protein